MPSKLYIKPKNPDAIDFSPMVTNRKAMKPTLFLTKVVRECDEDSESSCEYDNFQFEDVNEDQT